MPTQVMTPDRRRWISHYKREKDWNKQDIVEAILDYHRKFDRPPSGADWDPPFDIRDVKIRKEREARWKSGRYPTASIVRRIFTTMKNAVEGAGLEYNSKPWAPPKDPNAKNTEEKPRKRDDKTPPSTPIGPAAIAMQVRKLKEALENNDGRLVRIELRYMADICKNWDIQLEKRGINLKPNANERI